MKVDLRSRAEGVLLPIRAQAGARADALRGVQNGSLKVAVTQAAEKGKANKAILAVLAKELRLRRSQLQIVMGHTAPQKLVLVCGLSLDELDQRIQAVL
jgi:uncharacterized protein (TIGR00251 family)